MIKVRTQFSNWTFGDTKVKAMTFTYGDDTYTTYHKCHGDGWDFWSSDWFHADNIDTTIKAMDDTNIKFIDNDGEPIDVDMLLSEEIHKINTYLEKN